jgi:hypothetical protein
MSEQVDVERLIEQLLAANTSTGAFYPEDMAVLCREAAAEITALRGRVAAAEADAARWRTLMSIDPDKGRRLVGWKTYARPAKSLSVEDFLGSDATTELTIEHEELPVYEWTIIAVGEKTLQVAIDAAMSERK